ncbi:hypothetical protein PTD2_17840 [Pseudoalteromonas tunicata D2]|uniref:Uncharacterized protein n=1 Tax=Pseudoalteromonas tunicata D2 TaxID=87626 RepID=A4CBH1_9GAMM|nr:hypothetical protein PTD2_17840 [Pseudoalteromonas tunicata D2]
MVLGRLSVSRAGAENSLLWIIIFCRL